MSITEIGGTTIISNDGIPVAVIARSNRLYGHNQLDLGWNDVLGFHRMMVSSMDEGIQFMKSRIDAMATIQSTTYLFQPSDDGSGIPSPRATLEKIISRVMDGEEISDAVGNTSWSLVISA